MRAVEITLLHSRLAAWADRSFSSGVLVVLLLGNLLVGLNFLAYPDAAFSSPVYRIARMILPMPSWGLLFVNLTVICAVLRAVCGRCYVTAYVCGPIMSGVWLWWLALFALGPTRVDGVPTASLIAAVFALTFALLHALAGLGLVHDRGPRPAPPG